LSALAVRPITQRVARAWIAAHHSHLPPPVGWLMGVAVHERGRLCCLAVLERPARLLQDGTTACVSRVCSDRTPHAASMALAAVTRAALALGYRRLVSYMLAGQRGTSYRAAGWRITGVTLGGEWSRPSRVRGAARQPGFKIRWETGPAALPWDELAEAYAAAIAGGDVDPAAPEQLARIAPEARAA
jgi:hypothetical protein